MDNRLYAEQVAHLLGIQSATWRGRVSRANAERAAGRDRPGLAPDPDGHIPDGSHVRPWWRPETIRAYQNQRVPRGSRSHIL